jgi:hypothetical protein
MVAYEESSLTNISAPTARDYKSTVRQMRVPADTVDRNRGSQAKVDSIDDLVLGRDRMPRIGVIETEVQEYNRLGLSSSAVTPHKIEYLYPLSEGRDSTAPPDYNALQPLWFEKIMRKIEKNRSAGYRSHRGE